MRELKTVRKAINANAKEIRLSDLIAKKSETTEVSGWRNIFSKRKEKKKEQTWKKIVKEEKHAKKISKFSAYSNRIFFRKCLICDIVS